MNKVLVSGGFDPLHAGHIDLLKEASEYGEVWVALNSNQWLVDKKGYYLLPWEDRREVLGSLPFVSVVAGVDDADGTVCKAIEVLKPDYFVNGGDVRLEDTPERQLCEELDVEMLWTVGGSESTDTSRVMREDVRPWGRMLTFLEGFDGEKNYKVKALFIKAGEQTSLQYHEHRSERWMVMQGEGEATIMSFSFSNSLIKLTLGRELFLVQRSRHRLRAITDMVILEIQQGEECSEDDIVRIEDNYGRVDNVKMEDVKNDGVRQNGGEKDLNEKLPLANYCSTGCGED